MTGLAGSLGNPTALLAIGIGCGVSACSMFLPAISKFSPRARSLVGFGGFALVLTGVICLLAFPRAESWPVPTALPQASRNPASIGPDISSMEKANGDRMQIEPQVITVQGTVRTKGGQAVLFPQPGQDITEPTLLIMKDLPVGGNAQQRFNAAVAYFKPKTGVISVKGTLTPFDGDQIFIVVTD